MLGKESKLTNLCCPLLSFISFIFRHKIFPSGACFIQRNPASKASPSLHGASKLMCVFQTNGTADSGVFEHQASSSIQFWGSILIQTHVIKYDWCTVTCCGPQAWRFNIEGDQQLWFCVGVIKFDACFTPVWFGKMPTCGYPYQESYYTVALCHIFLLLRNKWNIILAILI